MSLEELTKALGAVSQARKVHADYKQQFGREQAKFNERVRLIKKNLDDAQRQVEVAEATAKRLAVEQFDEDGIKKPIDGIEIKTFTKQRLVYNAADALKWAKEKDLCLTLDQEQFEKAAPTLGLSFVNIEEMIENKAQLSSKL